MSGLLSLLGLLLLVHHAGTYLLWLYEERRHGPPRRPRELPAALTAWLGEGLAHLFALLTWPFGWWPERPRSAAGCVGRPVVLLHGWGMNRASMVLLAARLRRDGRHVTALNYPSVGSDTDAKAAHLAASVREVIERTGAERVDIVAHSLGGVVARALARRCGGLSFIGSLVTLGSPHGGAALADLLRWPLVRQLRTGSHYLTALAEDDPVPTAIRVTAISSLFDAIVFPAANAEYPGAMNVSIDYVGHMSLLLSGRVYDLVKESLEG